MTRENREDRPAEMPAVRTTIVGGRPPGSGTTVGVIPRGVEILIQKAAVDPEFKALLLEKRAEAAAEIELSLEPAEAAMLNAAPAAQLEAIIDRTKVPEATRRALLGKITAATLVVLGGGLVLRTCSEQSTLGIRPDQPQSAGCRPAREDDPDLYTRGIRPDQPQPARPPLEEDSATMEIRSDEPESTRALLEREIRDSLRNVRSVTLGIQPDRPPSRLPAGRDESSSPPE